MRTGLRGDLPAAVARPCFSNPCWAGRVSLASGECRGNPLNRELYAWRGGTTRPRLASPFNYSLHKLVILSAHICCLVEGTPTVGMQEAEVGTPTLTIYHLHTCGIHSPTKHEGDITTQFPH